MKVSTLALFVKMAEGGGEIKEKSLFPLHKSPLSPNHTHTKKDRTFMEAFLEKTVERTYIFKSHTI